LSLIIWCLCLCSITDYFHFDCPDSLGCETVLCVGEADLQLSVDARRDGVFAVLARDSDFSLMSGVQYIPFDSVDIV
jgi:hypothetical protein